MSIKENIDKILANPVEGVEPSIMILSYLDDIGLSLGGNGWVEEEVESLMWSDGVRKPLEAILKK